MKCDEIKFASVAYRNKLAALSAIREKGAKGLSSNLKNLVRELSKGKPQA